MTFWKKLTQPPAVEPKESADKSRGHNPINVAVGTWIVADILGATTLEKALLIGYPYIVAAAADLGASQDQESNRSPGTTPPVQ